MSKPLTSHHSEYTPGHAWNASSYASAEAGQPSYGANPSSAGNVGFNGSANANATQYATLGGEERRGLTQRSPSPSPTKPGFGFEHALPIPDPHASGSGPIALERSLSGHHHVPAPGGWSGITPQRIGRAVGARFMRAVRRGNLPFLLVFFSCTIVFFSALAGVGYHEPPELSETDLAQTAGGAAPPAGEFRVGGPVFDDRGAGMERRIAEQRALEESWAKKRRPKDGAWMRKQRDDKAVRRVRATATSEATTTATNAAGAVGAGTNDGLEAGQGLEKRDEDGSAGAGPSEGDGTAV